MSGRLRSLDGLRAPAVLLVFAHHVDQHALPGGLLGVELFFALSGYLITALLIGEHSATGGISLRSFYARRALRLMPALAVLAVAAAIRRQFSTSAGPSSTASRRCST
jgi:peptidoglycan/LPS O-acetylase OafA/YrhL